MDEVAGRLGRVEAELTALQGLVDGPAAAMLERARWQVMGVLASRSGRGVERFDEGADEPGRLDLEGGGEGA